MDDRARKAIIEMLEHDRIWASEVFSPEVGSAVIRLAKERNPGLAIIPNVIGPLVTEVVRDEQTVDLSKAIDLLYNWDRMVPRCLNDNFKLWLLTIIENDTDWFVKSAIETEYSTLTRPKKEVCDKIMEAIEEIRVVPTCQ